MISDCQLPIGDIAPKLVLIGNRQLAIENEMTPKEIAAHYDAKVFDSPDAAKVAGFVITETQQPRNVWNKASAASAIILKLVDKRTSGEADEIGLIIEAWRVTGCYKPHPTEIPAA